MRPGLSNEKKLKMLSDQFRRAVACAIAKGNTDTLKRFNGPVRERLAEREEARADAHVEQWTAAQQEEAARDAAAAELEAAAGRQAAAAEQGAAEEAGVNVGGDHGSAASQGDELY